MLVQWEEKIGMKLVCKTVGYFFFFFLINKKKIILLSGTEEADCVLNCCSRFWEWCTKVWP